MKQMSSFGSAMLPLDCTIIILPSFQLENQGRARAAVETILIK